MTPSTSDRELVDVTDMPKVELHVHLEGAIPLATRWEILQRHGGDPDVGSVEDLRARFSYVDFDHFIQSWLWQSRYLRTIEDFELAAERVAQAFVAQRIVYVEGFISPADVAPNGLSTADVVLAVRRGLDRVRGVEVALIVDLVRNYGPDRALRSAAEVAEVAAEGGVIGVGLGGSEAEFPPELFVEAFELAASRGLHRTVHAGEVAGPASIRGALDVLGAERIGHGVRAVEDRTLLERLVAEQTPLEVCPISNLRTGAVVGWAGHPAAELVAAGANVTVSSDDPTMFDCTLDDEYASLQRHLGVDAATVRRLASNAVQASWADPGTTARLQADLDAWWAAR